MSPNNPDIQLQNIEQIEKLYPAIAQADWDTVNSILSPELVLTEASGLPYGGTYVGHQGFLDLMMKLDQTWNDLHPEDMHLSAAGETVLADFLVVGSSKATGREIRMRLIEKWTFEKGQIVAGCVFYYDTHEVRNICGLA